MKNNGCVRVELTGHGRGKVYVDGHELSGVESVSVRARYGRPNRVHLVVYAEDVVTVAGEADVHIEPFPYSPVTETK